MEISGGLSQVPFVYILLVGSVNIANAQIKWSQSANFIRIQDGAWL